MTYVVTEACIACKYTDCIHVCPVDCFHEGENFLAIDPDVCIDCGICEAECPVEAIRSEAELGLEERHWIDLNAELVKKWPKITQKREMLPGAPAMAETRNKLSLLIR